MKYINTYKVFESTEVSDVNFAESIVLIKQDLLIIP